MLSRSVTLHLVDEPACPGEDLTFTCERATESGLLVWDIIGLSGVPRQRDAFGRTMNASVERITSPDPTPGENPSIITVRSVTAADNTARLQCRILQMELSNIITLSIRK